MCFAVRNTCDLVTIFSLKVAIEAIDKKTHEMALVVKLEPPDLKRLQLLLAGSISTQVNQGVQEYVAFFKDSSHFPEKHIDKLKEMYRLVPLGYLGGHEISPFKAESHEVPRRANS
jgi:hypothetical protein